MKIELKDLSGLRHTEVIDLIEQDEEVIVTASIYRDQSAFVECETVNDKVSCKISEEYVVNISLRKTDMIDNETIVKSKDFEYVQTRVEVKIEDSRYIREDLKEMIELEIIEIVRSQTLENPDSVYLLRFEDE
jgi:hypothetical protein